ncbi:VaFE repeat-containing surface-anchored protein [Microbacterium sp. ZW T5_45]|uniref:VaFE repeat-containing surface-anchored protein n=1 Tax=Microbacterium sp. ZW T5_45 TaxID=3378080 RepID=UPI003853FD84
MKMSGGALRQESRARKWAAVLAALAVSLVTVGIVPIAVQSAAADVPPTPITAPFDAPLCENTTGNPVVDADGGPVTNLLSVFGQRLTNYNNGDPVILYNNSGRSGWTSSGSQYAANPICVTRYVDEIGGPVSAWTYCTFDRASVCSWTNANGELERQGTVLPPVTEVPTDPRLTDDQKALQAFIIQNDLPVVAGPTGSGGTVAVDTVANNDSPAQRSLRQDLVHCIDNPTRTSGLVFCESNMSAETQAQILAKINATPATQLGATSPSATLLPGETGEIELTTTITTPLTLTITGGTLTVCAGEPATLAGDTLVVDADATLPATISLCATRADAGTVSVSVSGLPPVTTNAAYFQSSRFEGDTLCQIFAVYSDEQPEAVTTSGSVVFAEDEVVPTIATSLVDELDGDKYVAQAGGTVIDTISYDGLQPNTQYTVSGELYDQADGTATGITGSTTFTSSATGTGTVDVEFTIDAAHAGQTLVAFEVLTLGGAQVASHEDIDDAAQTIYVSDIGTTLVDQADGDKNVSTLGGIVVDTIAYTNLVPNTAYTVSGELYDKTDGTATGITGTASFTSSATGSGTVDVSFLIDDQWAGRTLVAFETVSRNGVEVASHEDIDDAAQTVALDDAPAIGTLALTDNADDDKVLPLTGGTITDTVSYTNLPIGECVDTGAGLECLEQYYVTGELMFVDDGGTVTPTGITATTEPDYFQVTNASERNGTVDVTFTVTAAQAQQYSGGSLVVYEQLSRWYYGFGFPVVQDVAAHEDAEDADQTVAVEARVPLIGTTLADELDGDKYIVQSGGTVIDTVAYEGLVPNTEYTVTGELHDQVTGAATGITGSATFTSSATGTGTVEVEFTITDEWAGRILTAFEVLTLGDDVVATHEDITDAAQTVYVADLGTTLLDAADGDKNVASAGGTVIDTVTYTNLKPNSSYIVSGELYDKADGTATGITGTTTFTSSATGNGTVEVEFTIDGDWAGATLVAFETVSEGDLIVAVHEDINDGAQTVTVGNAPLIGTTLADDLDGDKYIVQTGGTVIDTVAYENLEPNTEYTVSGELHDQETGEATGITGSTAFTSSATGTGTVEVEFTITDEWAGHTLTAFEVLTLGETTVATHEDINDAAQTVYVADLGTTLVDRADGDKNVASAGGTVVDTVAYTNLAPNTSYTVSGELYDKATGEATGITGTAQFTSSNSGNGTVEVTFVINGDWAGSTLVAFEVLTQGDVEVASHEDINDTAQTVFVGNAPRIGTTLADELDGDKYIVQNGGTVIDTVAYVNLEPNTEYTVTGELWDRETGEATGITGSTTFTSSASGTGEVEVEFTITDEWAGHTLTAFEVLTLGDDVVATHEDINDDAQTVYIADLGTTLVDDADGDKNVASAGGTVVDTVAYENLAPNTEYTVSGELFDKATGEPTGITGSATFTSSATGAGTVEVEFVIDGEWAGRTLVAFETVTQGERVIAVHEDINDTAQTVFVGNAPRIGTTLADELDGDKYIVQNGGTVIDTVAYENLEPDTEYTVTGELHDQQTGEATGITGSATFTSSATGTGSVEVVFDIPAGWAGHTLTAFEVLTLGDDVVATHEDITDAAQTVYVADIGTTLVDRADGDKNVAASGGVVIDTVAYTHLAPNTEYTVSGELYDKATGTATGITGSTTFTSSTTGSGSVDVGFVINENWAGHTLVAFEVIMHSELEVAAHEDIDDAAQTVTVDRPGLAVTGLGAEWVWFAGAGTAALVAGAALLLIRRRQNA